MLLALLIACRCSTAEQPQDVSFASPQLRQVGGRFRGEADAPLAPEVAFAVQARCPRIERVHVRPVNAQIHELTVYGSGLDTVTRIGAALPDGKLANARFEHEGAALVFPVACDACEVYLGVKAGDRTAACIGPGYSLTVYEGHIVP
jgi:hypothetical protein